MTRAPEILAPSTSKGERKHSRRFLRRMLHVRFAKLVARVEEAITPSGPSIFCAVGKR